MSQNNLYVGIDLGGTTIKLALITQEGQIAFKIEKPTNVSAGGESILQQMNEMIAEGLQSLGLKRENLIGIGIGAPAMMEMATGFVYEAVNLGWKNFPLKELLEQITGLPVVADNDANTAALGEMWQGAGQGAQELLCITLGTGVGGGVIVDGQICHGMRGAAGEVGHITVIPEGGYQCNCGKTGCLETVASATGIVKLALEALQENQPSRLAEVVQRNGKLEARDVASAAEQGDALALAILDKVGFYLGWVLGNYAVTLNPSKIVVGGGVAKAGDLLLNPIRKYYKKYALPHLTGEIEIVPATLGNDAGVIGAAWLVHSKQ